MVQEPSPPSARLDSVVLSRLSVSVNLNGNGLDGEERGMRGGEREEKRKREKEDKKGV